VGHVSALAVGDHEQARAARMDRDLGKRPRSRPAETFEARQLQLDSDARAACAVDERAAMRFDRACG
jgi:hypothetical protein